MKILVVDDHAPFRLILRHILHDHEILEAETGEDALEKFPDADVVLLDINMPGMGGMTTLTKMKAQRQATPVWMLSSSDDPDDVEASRERGANGYIIKRGDADHLRDSMAQALDATAWLVV